MTAPPEPGPVAGVQRPTSEQESSAGLRGSTVLLGGRLFSVLVGIATQIVLVRNLPTAEFGLFALGLAVVAAVRIVVSLGHNRTISRFFSLYRERQDAGRLVGTLVMEAALISVLGLVAAAAAVVTWWLGGREGGGLVGLLAFFLLLAPLEALEELLENLFAAYGRVGVIVVRQHLVAPLLRLGVVVGLALSGAGVVFVALGYLLATAVGLALYAVVLRTLLREDEVLRQRAGPRSYPAREVFGYSLPLLSTELVYLSTSSLNAVLLGASRGPASVGALRAVQPFVDANLLVRRQFHRLFLPLASVLHDRGEAAGLREAYWRSAAWVAVLSFPLFLVTGPLATQLVSFLLGERYAGSAPYLLLLATASYVNAALGFNAEVLQAVARLRYLVCVNVTTAAVALGGAALTAIPFGALGVAVTTAAALVVQNVLNQAGLRGVLGSGLPPRPYRRVYVAVVAGAAAAFGLEAALAPSLPVGVLGAAVLSLLVLTASRRALDVTSAFPALGRIPVLGRLL